MDWHRLVLPVLGAPYSSTDFIKGALHASPSSVIQKLHQQLLLLLGALAFKQEVGKGIGLSLEGYHHVQGILKWVTHIVCLLLLLMVIMVVSHAQHLKTQWCCRLFIRFAFQRAHPIAEAATDSS